MRKAFPPRVHDYDIRLKADGTPVLFTTYKGHNFEGWISQANMEKAESDGVLAWDASGQPVIDPSKLPRP